MRAKPPAPDGQVLWQRVTETVDWMLRDLKLGGGFAAGFDGDSDGE